MNRLKTLALALAALGLVAPATAHAAEPDRSDRDKDTAALRAQYMSKHGGDVGDCSLGTAQADLDANNVRARMFNTGGLFWKGGNAEYEVPRGSGLTSIFASGIWIGGEVGGELRVAWADYGDWEFWPGPLGPDGAAPTRESCQEFDRFWKISQDDIDQYLDSGATTNDLLTWPADLGAPVLSSTANGLDDDGDGLVDEGFDGIDNDEDDLIDERDEQEFVDANAPDRGGVAYDLAGGDLPDIIGNQTIWWIMNDRGNAHLNSNTAPIGLEVTVQAFAFATSNAINNTTFYKYEFRYKGAQALQNTYLGLWSDPDLGDYQDDYVGSDPELGLGFVYNSDDDDAVSAAGYGDRPPALGYDYFQGPLVNNDGVDNDEDGEVDEDDERIALSTFLYYNNDNNPVNGNPGDGIEVYNYLRAIWRDGSLVTFGGDGTDQANPRTTIMFPGNPPEYWSEFDASDAPGEQPNVPADRRFLMASGPFTINPGDTQEIVFGIVWSQASDGGALGSVAKLKNDDALAQSAFDADFEVPRPPDAPIVNAQPLDGAVALTWSNPRTSNNFNNSYDVFTPFSDPSADDRTYTLEGYEVFQLDSPAQSIDQGTRLAVFDRDNGITTVVDQVIDDATGVELTQVVARGLDNGLQNSFTVRGLVNNQTYFFAVRAYAYNEATPFARVYSSPVLFGTNLVSVIPSKQSSVAGGTVIQADTGDSLPAVVTSGDVRSPFAATVADPGAITGDTYEVRFRNISRDGADVLIYDVFNTTTGELEFDGEMFFDRLGVTPISNQLSPTNEFLVNDQVPIIDGFQLAIVGLTGADVQLYGEGCGELQPAAGEIDFGSGRPIQRVVFERTSGSAATPPQGAVVRFNNATEVNGDLPQLDFPGYDDPSFSFLEVIGPGGAEVCTSGNTQGCAESGGEGVWVYGPNQTYASDIPASLNNGTNSTGEYHVTSLSAGPEGNLAGFAPNRYEIRLSGSSYVYHPFTDTPGHPGYSVPYEVWDIGTTPDDPSDDIKMIPNIFSDAAAGGPDSGACDSYAYSGDIVDGKQLTHRIYAYYPTTTYAAWEAAVETLLFPYQEGTVIQINTADFAAIRGDAEAEQDALDLIAAVPNPYRGTSLYETGANDRQIRFVNLPSSATIRIFTISGTLVREIVKPTSNSTVAFWDLENQRGLPVASGMYLVHVEARNPDGNVVGERVLKLGIVQRRPSIDIL